MKTVAIIPAAGSGTRMKNDRAKQFIDLEGRPLLALTLVPFQDCRKVDSIILVTPEPDVQACRREIVDRYKLDKVKAVVAGGKRRQDSVRLGIEAIKGEYDLVLIHDGVRPMVDAGFIERVINEAVKYRAVITGLPAKETVKEVDVSKKVLKTYDRERVWLVQTPQVFRYNDIVLAHKKAFEEEWDEVTDDCALVEKMGIEVNVVEGIENNIKVTTPFDLDLVRFLLGQRHKAW